MTWWGRLLGRSAARSDDPPVPLAEAADVPATPAPGPRPATALLGTTRSGREIRAFPAPADQLVAWWHHLRAEHPTTGLWPVLVGPEVGDMFAALTPEDAAHHDDAAELARAAAVTPADLAARHRERAQRYGDGSEALDEPPGAVAPRSVRRHDARFTVAEQDGLVVLVPAAHGWEVPAVLGWAGGCNLDLEPVDHVATLRDWHARHGAELVPLSADQVLEVLVRRPPTTPEEALAVASEQYTYCPDVVDQGAGTIRDLARDQVGSRSWYFWWD